MVAIRTGTPANSNEEWILSLTSLAKESGPTLFSLKALLPTQGRTDLPLAATNDMSVILKIYASGGENGLHAHVNEDHTFVVLQGSAKFYGIEDTHVATLSKHQGILLPRGVLYRFETVGDEALVMLRVGCADISQDPVEAFARVGEDGRDMDSYSHQNKQEELRYDREAWFAASA